MSSIESGDAAIFQNGRSCSIFSKLEGKYYFASFAIVFLSSAIFGLWFKVKQISIASPEILRFYPVTGYAIAALQSILLFAVLWLGLVLACRAIDHGRSDTASNLFAGSLPFTAFMLSLFDVALSVQFRLFLLLAVVLLFLKVYRNRSLLEEAKEPLTVLILYFLIYLFAVKSFSPLFYAGFYELSGRVDYLATFESQWEVAKAYDFLGGFAQNFQLGGLFPMWLVSELLSLIVLLFDIPLVDDSTKYALIPQLCFYLFVIGSYGCYYFLRRGLQLSLLPSFIGGVGFIFGNASFLSLLNNEWPLYWVPFHFFPWVCFLLKRAHDLNKPVLACTAGMFASLVEYVWSSHPETTLGYIFFGNTYNMYLVFVRLARDHHERGAVRRFFRDAFLFPFFIVVGLSYKEFPLFEALAIKQLSLMDVTGNVSGLGWTGYFKHYSTFFFRIEDMSKFSPLTWNADISDFRPLISSITVFFYTGQFAILMIFSFVFYFFAEVFRKFFKKNENAELKGFWGNVFYFLAMFLILAWVVPMGSKSWVGKFMVWSGFLRVHYIVRWNIYYYFIALVSAVCGLEYVLRQKKLFVFNVLFGAYILTLAGVYFSPMLLAIPDRPLLDAVILFATYLSIALYIKAHAFFENEKSVASYQSLLGLVIVVVAFFSFLTVHTDTTRLATTKRTETEAPIFTSFRTQVAYLRNNQHDRASFEHLEQRVQRFREDIHSKEWGIGVISLSDYDKIARVFEQFEHSNQLIKNVQRDIKQNKINIFGDFFGETKALDMSNYLLANKIAFFEAIAPEVDSFYLKNSQYNVPIMVAPHEWSFLAYGVLNGMLYYLPDKYQLYAFVGGNSGFLAPFGKSFSVTAPPAPFKGASYPSIHVNSYLRDVYHSSFRQFDELRMEYFELPLTLEMITTNKNAKKVFNVIGLDYLLFFNNHLQVKPSSSRALETLRSMGLVQVAMPESSQFPPNLSTGDQFKFYAFNNPQSYGKAYVAKWVKTMKPEENKQNLDLRDPSNKAHSVLDSGWGRSKELIRDFEINMAKIPDDIEKAALIETVDARDYSESPQIFKSTNDVNIVKIIGSKAVFDVDCKDENCWFVYNTAALKGWDAFSGSTRLPIHKANLGFIGVKLNKGKHLVWMEYRPFSLSLWLVFMLSGWLLVFAVQVFRSTNNEEKSNHIV